MSKRRSKARRDLFADRPRDEGDDLATAALELATRRIFAVAKPPPRRTMREFAEAEIWIPDGLYEGDRFSCDRQPVSRLWFDAVEDERWQRLVAIGPAQTGKSFLAFIVPTLYHLFEMGETVIMGVPDANMGADKWREDLLPVINKTRYRNLLPASGSASKGGNPRGAVKFQNGATLRIMTGGGGTKSIAGYTSRVLVITEVDGFGRVSSSSESDRISLLEARTRQWRSQRRIYLECTVTTKRGRIWQEYERGSAARPLIPCEHCGEFVCPGRDDLRGWRGAETDGEAERQGAYYCPSCEKPWTEPGRREGLKRMRLAHRGQSIEANGKLSGEAPDTRTLGFWWSAPHNSFTSAGDMAADEFNASKRVDEDDAERDILQNGWALPYEGGDRPTAPLEALELGRRQGSYRKGVAPEKTSVIVAAMDLGRHLAHYTVAAYAGDDAHVIDYGRLEVAGVDLGDEIAVSAVLREFRDMVLAGWPVGSPRGECLVPDQVWIDAGWQTQTVYERCAEFEGLDGYPRFRPAFGRGQTQSLNARQVRYKRPKSTGASIRWVGDECHIARLKAPRIEVVEVNADAWKSKLHRALRKPTSSPGALVLFAAPPNEHISFAKHLTAEQEVEGWDPKSGATSRWELLRKANHWLDSSYSCFCALHFCGFQRPAPPQKQPNPRHEPEVDDELGFEVPEYSFTLDED